MSVVSVEQHCQAMGQETWPQMPTGYVTKRVTIRLNLVWNFEGMWNDIG